MMDVGTAQEYELAEIASFYSDVGYPGGVLPTDTVLIARTGDGVIGAVRLCEEEDCLVLRGMYVGSARRGEGIGAALLSAAGVAIGCRECWCVPYAHLGKFYGRAGFMETAADAAPRFLADRSAKYRGKGEDVVIMMRPSTERRHGPHE